MRKFILIRTYREEDRLVCKELLKASVMYSLNHTYIGFLLGQNIMRIVIFAAIVLMVILIHLGIPVGYSVMVIFMPATVLYLSLYAMFWCDAKTAGYEASEIPRIYTPDNSSCFWVAEVHEVHTLNRHERSQRYRFMTEEKLIESNIDVSGYNKKIVGIISFCRSNWTPTFGWIKRLYVQKNYRRKGIGRKLVNRALYFAEEYRFERVKILVTQYQKVVMEFFNTRDFSVKVIRDHTFLFKLTMYEYVFRTTHYRSFA
ncbi:uncharacterized protein LOC124421624 isoform X1 [Vespa crabro]|uniref:uncharacterized protein LOC124421624 isoform X1 n=2 Tax=Vespa crabro TaxID=7445 RepID=UPI001F016709|nr:uncharacterized protein LOC124421624 isoform X1 [Vespa crabro]